VPAVVGEYPRTIPGYSSLCAPHVFIRNLSGRQPFLRQRDNDENNLGGITMKTFVSLLVLALATAFTAPAFAQETAAPATKADCEKAKGTWDDATSKCTLPK
jgi:hypothetical protein